MSVLEKAVANLADALDHLERRLDDRFDNDANAADDMAAARRQAHAAKAHTEEASRGVGAAIEDVKSLLAKYENSKG